MDGDDLFGYFYASIADCDVVFAGESHVRQITVRRSGVHTRTTSILDDTDSVPKLQGAVEEAITTALTDRGMAVIKVSAAITTLNNLH